MIDDIPHDFLLSLKKFVPGIDVLHNEFFNRYFSVIVYINLVKYFVDHLISHFFIIYLLLISEENVKLLFCDITIMIDIDEVKFLLQLPAHVILEACLLNTPVDCVRI